MVTILNSKDSSFEDDLQNIMDFECNISGDVVSIVDAIIRDVRKRKNEALLEYTKKLDNADFSEVTISVSEEEIENAYNSSDKELIGYLEEAKDRIEKYHILQRPDDKIFTDDAGVKLGWKWTSVESVGLYVPGGLASYPSSVLMNAIPAITAGVDRIVMVVPAPNGILNPLVLAAAKICGITEIYKIGGAQAIAALAYGTETISPVKKIVGPGNAYVAAAKRQVFGKVGIDMIAGPSEIMIVADKNNNPRWIAADLLSQAEHDEIAKSILVTDDKNFADEVINEVSNILQGLDKKDIAEKSWNNNGVVIIIDKISDAVSVVDTLAPEHLELAIDDPEKMSEEVRNAGAIFMGKYTPEAIGDYIAGPSHVLPTSGSACFSSGLGVLDFMKRTSLISCTEESFEKISEQTARFAKEEGLTAHELSVRIRNSNY